MRRKAQQYTIRSVPPAIDRALRQRARSEGKSLNEVTLETLRRGLDLDAQPRVYHDLDRFVGTWVEDPAFDEAIAAQDQIDEDLWK
jgi:hypothetical protein